MKTVFYLIFFTLASCSVQKGLQGDFMSSCNLYNQTSLKLTLNENGEFQYHFAYNDEIVKGKWILSGDTLILNSDKFLIKRDPISPKIQNTDLADVDKYLVKQNKLFVINKTGMDKNCFLITVKK